MSRSVLLAQQQLGDEIRAEQKEQVNAVTPRRRDRLEQFAGQVREVVSGVELWRGRERMADEHCEKSEKAKRVKVWTVKGGRPGHQERCGPWIDPAGAVSNGFVASLGGVDAVHLSGSSQRTK